MKVNHGMVTCRPYISFPLIKLSQYSAHPTLHHFKALQELYNYIRATKTEGIYYRSSLPRHDLLVGELPTTKGSNKYIPETRQ